MKPIISFGQTMRPHLQMPSLTIFEAAFSSSNYFMSSAAEHMNEKVSPYLALLTKLHEEIPAINRVISNRGGIGLGTATYLQSDGTVADSDSMNKNAKATASRLQACTVRSDLWKKLSKRKRLHECRLKKALSPKTIR